MSLSRKLQIRKGQSVRLINAPKEFRIDTPVSGSELADLVLLFAQNSSTLDKLGKLVFETARRDGLAWIAYPKAGKLSTDLNRDKLRELVKPYGIQPVRLVSIDDTWAAMRFRPTGQ